MKKLGRVLIFVSNRGSTFTLSSRLSLSLSDDGRRDVLYVLSDVVSRRVVVGHDDGAFAVGRLGPTQPDPPSAPPNHLGEVTVAQVGRLDAVIVALVLLVPTLHGLGGRTL